MASLVVIIPTKNRVDLLPRALASVRQQTGADYRVVIVNDGSTDGTHKYLASLDDPRVTCIEYKQSRGVNAARNAGMQTLQSGEWAVLLDDDDLLVPGAFDVITDALHTVPADVEALCFATILRTKNGDRPGGQVFDPGEVLKPITYYGIMTGGRRLGDSRSVFKWTLQRYPFAEDVNGFENEWYKLLIRDGVQMQYRAAVTTIIDMAHEGEHLSAVNMLRNPEAFLRGYGRLLRDHAAFFAKHPTLALGTVKAALALAIRARDVGGVVRFGFRYLYAWGLSLVRREP